jgi:hypothetical protein
MVVLPHRRPGHEAAGSFAAPWKWRGSDGHPVAALYLTQQAGAIPRKLQEKHRKHGCSDSFLLKFRERQKWAIFEQSATLLPTAASLQTCHSRKLCNPAGDRRNQTFDIFSE